MVYRPAPRVALRALGYQTRARKFREKKLKVSTSLLFVDVVLCNEHCEEFLRALAAINAAPYEISHIGELEEVTRLVPLESYGDDDADICDLSIREAVCMLVNGARQLIITPSPAQGSRFIPRPDSTLRTFGWPVMRSGAGRGLQQCPLGSHAYRCAVPSPSGYKRKRCRSEFAVGAT